MILQHAPRTIIEGVVGSTAYGLAHEHSDIDTMRVSVQPTSRLIGVYPPPKPVLHQTDPDVTDYELGHLIGLLLKSNPTVSEALWLPDDCYRHVAPLGRELIDMRKLFLTASHARKAYLGYLNGQVKLCGRIDNPRRVRKAKTHIARLCVQAAMLWETGELVVRPPDPANILAAGEHSTIEDLQDAVERLADLMDGPTPLQQDVPAISRAVLNDWLVKARCSFL